MYSKDKLAYEPVPLPDRFDLSDPEMLHAVQAFYDHMRRRHSVRDFSDRPVPEQVIATAVRAAGTAPSGANHQPWHFVAIADPQMKAQIRAAAEEEEQRFYAGGAGDEWLKALEPIGTGVDKPHLTVAPWLIVIFAQRYGVTDAGDRYKHYYVPESVGIATGMLITALHQAGLCCLTHTPNPMKFLNGLCARPDAEKPVMILAVGHPAETATVPAVAKIKKPPEQILTVYRPDEAP
ncbi:nitroreductase family protein [Thalassobius sp. S69A]|uniref:nitroreductase family protein n=1 Tax=unclassified Thalassovita TaxID=2619711 RepID=UPI000C0DCECC|nr:nitroreductase family protein [Paracoccaceae bacterium]MBT25942.1 nitroreductase family protein [Paracoccaceae bacterium]